MLKLLMLLMDLKTKLKSKVSALSRKTILALYAVGAVCVIAMVLLLPVDDWLWIIGGVIGGAATGTSLVLTANAKRKTTGTPSFLAHAFEAVALLGLAGSREVGETGR